MKQIKRFLTERLKLNSNSKAIEIEDKTIIIVPWNEDMDFIANIVYRDDNKYLNKTLEIYDERDAKFNLDIFFMPHKDYIIIKDKFKDPKTQIYTYTKTKLSIHQLVHSFAEQTMSLKDLEKIN